MRHLFLLAALAGSLHGRAQAFPKDTVLFSGPGANRVQLVYLGDGYTAAELPLYLANVQTINDAFFNTSPFKEYKAYFNAYAVRVPSGASGARHAGGLADCGGQPAAAPLNYFGSRFDVGGIHRLVVPDSGAKVQSVLAANYPSYNQVVLLVNSAFYGGSGGAWATATTNAASAEIAIHEIGHSFAGLADEYWAGAVYAGERPNMTAVSDPATVKWNSWVGTSSVGVYPYVGGPSWYRPVQGSACKMEVLNVPFCPVCRETIVERIHGLVRPYDSYAPANAVPLPLSGGQGFSLALVRPDPNSLKVSWTLDGSPVAQNTDTLTLQAGALGAGTHTLLATITDTTALTRSATHVAAHAYSIAWHLSATTGIGAPELAELRVLAYPNPFSDELRVNYELKKRSDVRLELLNLAGVPVRQQSFRGQAPGRYLTVFRSGVPALPAGTYLLVVTVNGNRMAEEKIKL
ncbi:MAG: hypothetical protein EOO11_09315 [Chitinophagaceae bacterium]|nr:MAG: hypothetical protein EOO11_09315 [Chitinophagaceae bacterium]